MEHLDNIEHLACLALHLRGASLTKNFRNYKMSNYVETGLSIYGIKFNNLMEEANTILHEHLSRKISVLSIIDKNYPILLKKSLNPPLCLFYSGDIHLLENPRISVIGTREPSIFTTLWVNKLSRYLSKHGFVLVSGLANGIDSIVHLNAIVQGTIGILPHSLDIWHPARNRYLFQKALDNQKVLLLSEYPVKTETRKFHFVHRNRIIAGISSQTILAEAGIGSGALITANYAIQNQRKVHVLYHELQKNNVGGKLLIEKGFAKTLTDSFPVEVHRRNFLQRKDFKEKAEYFYLGNDLMIFFNEHDFSIKSLQPASLDQDFAQCSD